jgi:betaine-aldehyde dehydrogenase
MSSAASGNFIDGDYVEPAARQPRTSIDPATGEVYGVSPVATAEDIDHAYPRGIRAFETWAETTPAERQLRCSASRTRWSPAPRSSPTFESQDTGKPRATLVADEIMQSVGPAPFLRRVPHRNLEGRSAGEYLAGHTSSSAASRSASCAGHARGTTR